MMRNRVEKNCGTSVVRLHQFQDDYRVDEYSPDFHMLIGTLELN